VSCSDSRIVSIAPDFFRRNIYSYLVHVFAELDLVLEILSCRGERLDSGADNMRS